MSRVAITALVDTSLNDLGYGKVPGGNSIWVEAGLAERSVDLRLAKTTGKVRVRAEDEPREVRPAGEIRVPFQAPLVQPIPKVIVPPTTVSSELLQVLIGRIDTLTHTVQELRKEVHELKGVGVSARDRQVFTGQPEEVFIPTIGEVKAEVTAPTEHLVGGSVDEASNTLRATKKKRGIGNG